MNQYRFTVVVECDTPEQADTVIASRLGYDEEIEPEDGGPFKYGVDWTPSRAVREPEGPTFRFYLGGHLTFVTDIEGDVVGLEIMPYQESPCLDDYQPDSKANMTDADSVLEKANSKCWDFPALLALPNGITWEV